MKKMFVVILIGLMLMAVSSFAQESIPEFNAANVNKAKIASKVNLSKDADDMLALMVKFAPGTKFQLVPGLKKDSKSSCVGKIGKFEIITIQVEKGNNININFSLKGKRIEEEVMPVLREMYGDPEISDKDIVLAMQKAMMGLDTKFETNDYKRIMYGWENSKMRISVAANDDLIYTYEDGRIKKARPMETLIIFVKR